MHSGPPGEWAPWGLVAAREVSAQLPHVRQYTDDAAESHRSATPQPVQASVYVTTYRHVSARVPRVDRRQPTVVCQAAWPVMWDMFYRGGVQAPRERCPLSCHALHTLTHIPYVLLLLHFLHAINSHPTRHNTHTHTLDFLPERDD